MSDAAIEIADLAEQAKLSRPNSYKLVGRKAGRPSEYDPEIAEIICDLTADGQSVRTICLDARMPDRKTVLKWLDKYPDFSAKYARARMHQADVMDELILSTAMDCTPETAAADRVKIGAFQWRAARLNQGRYGDKMDLTAKAEITHVVDNMDLANLSADQREALRDIANALLERRAQGQIGNGEEEA